MIERALFYLPLLALLLWASIEDWRRRRVPNWLTFSLVLAGLALSFSHLGLVSAADSGIGCVVGLAIGMALMSVNGMKAGDAKLLAGVGAWVGWLPVLLVFAGAAIVGLLITVFQALRLGRVRRLVGDSLLMSVNLMQGTRSQATPELAAGENPGAPGVKTLPFALSVLVATVAFVALLAVRSASGR